MRSRSKRILWQSFALAGSYYLMTRGEGGGGGEGQQVDREVSWEEGLRNDLTEPISFMVQVTKLANYRTKAE